MSDDDEVQDDGSAKLVARLPNFIAEFGRSYAEHALLTSPFERATHVERRVREESLW